jgi:hypothetical protein
MKRLLGGVVAIACFALGTGACTTAASPVASTTGGTLCSGLDVLWQKNYADVSAMRADVPAFGLAPELMSGVQTILVVYDAGLSLGVTGAPTSINGSIETTPSSGPGHRTICIYQVGRGANYYVDVDVPDHAP